MQLVSERAAATSERAQAPEIAADKANAAAINALFRDSGAVVIRAFFTPDEIATLQQIAKLVFAVADAAVSSAPADLLADDFAGGLRVGYISWPRMNALLQAAAPKLHGRLTAICERTRSIGSACYGGGQVRQLDNFNLIRRHRKNRAPDELTTVPWHRDFTFTSPAGYMESMNCWVPTVDVGGQFPSLDLILGSHSAMTGKPDESPGITQLSPAFVAAQLGHLEQCTPHCAPGDMIVFDHHTVHRTQPLSFAADRISFEFRWAPAQPAT